MKEFTLDKKRWSDHRKGNNFFFERDILESIKSCTPGEWIRCKVDRGLFLGYVNPFVQNGSPVTLLSVESEDPSSYIINKLKDAVRYRKLIGYANGSRIIHGFADGLPGLIIDEYSEIVVIQINTAGIDKFRNELLIELKKLIGKEVYFLDNPKYRKDEGLPEYEKQEIPDLIKIVDMGIEYILPAEVLQKIGYYYDHRENRERFEKIINRMDKSFTKGLDLFSYIGSWGLHALRAGVKKVEFVDQANMNDVTLKNADINGFTDQAVFIRSDVFDFLKSSISKGCKYDLVICDPPAFNKSIKNKRNSIVGYEKLYRSIFKIIDNDGIIVAASCTQNLSLGELDEVVVREAIAQNKKIRLIDIGLQGLDHPINSLKSKSNYIKYLCYIVE